MGIEPTYTAWKAVALPLCYTRAKQTNKKYPLEAALYPIFYFRVIFPLLFGQYHLGRCLLLPDNQVLPSQKIFLCFHCLKN